MSIKRADKMLRELQAEAEAAAEAQTEAIAKLVQQDNRKRVPAEELALVQRAVSGEGISGPVCAISGCGRETHAYGVCHKHYDMALRYSMVPSRSECSEPGCTNRSYSRGLCHLHYDRERERRTAKTCAQPGCNRPARKRLCSRCYMRAWHAKQKAELAALRAKANG